MVFLTIGAKENLTPPAMAQALFQSAGQPKQLYQVSGADHNDIVEIGGQMLEDGIRGSFRRYSESVPRSLRPRLAPRHE